MQDWPTQRVLDCQHRFIQMGADPDCLKPTAFSRLPVAQRNDTIEDILYMDTRPIGVDARPIITG